MPFQHEERAQRTRLRAAQLPAALTAVEHNRELATPPRHGGDRTELDDPGYEVTNREANRRAGAADHQHLQPRHALALTANPALGDSESEQRHQRAADADRQRGEAPERHVGPQRDDRREQVGQPDHESVAERRTADVRGESQLLFDLRAQEDVRIGRQADRYPLGVGPRETFLLERDGELGAFTLGKLLHLTTFVGDLGLVERLLGLRGQEGAGAHRDRAGNRLREPGDEDRGATRVGGRHPGDHAKRHQKPILGAEHELSDPGHALDTSSLAFDVITDVPFGLGTRRRGDHANDARRLRGAGKSPVNILIDRDTARPPLIAAHQNQRIRSALSWARLTCEKPPGIRIISARHYGLPRTPAAAFRDHMSPRISDSVKGGSTDAENMGMGNAVATPRSTVRMFAIHAAITFAAVLGLGLVLGISFRSDANQRALAQGRSEATLIAQTAVEPQLDGRPLSAGISTAGRASLQRLVNRAVREGDVLRLRLRDLAGRVVFSDDGSGIGAKPEDEALAAGRGAQVARLTHLNADRNDHGHRGVASVETYLPLSAGTTARRVGVLEIYLPYAPIARDVSAGLHRLYLDLALGLTALYLLLFAITVSVSRGLRREVAISAFLAHHDTLTELPNRTLFLSRAEAALARAVQSRQAMAIAIIDLDRFKDINDTLGHQSGDLLLTELALRVSANMRPGDTVARLGGDEFGLILCDVAGAERALFRLRDVIEREVEIRGLRLSVQASIGFVTASEAGTDVDTLLQYADVAMYAAKTQHAGVVEYQPELDHYEATNLSLVAELRHAIDADELVLHYQPQSNIVTGSIDAVEALVRWQHPTHGLLYPDRFLPLAEQTDLIDKLTEWVLATALVQMRNLSALGSDVAVAVNVSARNIGRADFARKVIQALSDFDVTPERLIIEVTETALLTDPARAARVLTDLAQAGVSVSLDDFGRGHTSLGYLSALPVHELKIDRSFVTDMSENPAHAAIVRSIIDLGHNLSMRVVAEGIETEDVLATLRQYSCDLAQGFLLARPMPAEDLEHLLAHIAKPVLPPQRAINAA